MLNANRVVYLMLFLSGGLLLFCNRDRPQSIADKLPFENLAPDVKYVGMQTCRGCHANIHDTYIHTGMGRSFDRATREKSAAAYGKHVLVFDEKSNFYYYPYFDDGALYVMEFRIEEGDTTHKRVEKISYIVGSGQHTNSHIIDINGYIYQAPVTYYTQEGRWDLAPGYEAGNERFDRFLTTECITCHNHFPDFVEGSLNKYSSMPSGIECERCHGPGEIHVREKLAGNIVDTSRFIDYTIVNPRHLPRDLQMDLCQRCHLQGVAVLEEGKTFFDFKPGMRLQEVFNVFLPRYTDSHEKFIMASQADRLRLSKCYELSEMTCLTCHNPHVSVQATEKNNYNKACLSCHGDNKTVCAAPMSDRLAEGDNCSGCHMPRSGSIDIPHVNITDHYISRTNVKGKAPAAFTGRPQFLGLQILTKDNPTSLDMARGYIALFDKYVASPVMLDSAKHYLDRSKLSVEEKFSTLVHYHFAREDYPAILELAMKMTPGKIDDGWTAYRIGEAWYKIQDYPRAREYFAEATRLMPYQLDFQEKLGAACINMQQLPQAKTALEFVLRENPKRKVALSNLGFIHALEGRLDEAEALYDRALDLDPDYEQALLNKAAVRNLRNDRPGARKLLERVLRVNPANEQAQAVLRQLGEAF